MVHGLTVVRFVNIPYSCVQCGGKGHNHLGTLLEKVCPFRIYFVFSFWSFLINNFRPALVVPQLMKIMAMPVCWLRAWLQLTSQNNLNAIITVNAVPAFTSHSLPCTCATRVQPAFTHRPTPATHGVGGGSRLRHREMDRRPIPTFESRRNPVCCTLRVAHTCLNCYACASSV